MSADVEDADQGGLCLCQQDSYLRTLVTTVVSCTKLETPPPPPKQAGKGGKGGSKAAAGAADAAAAAAAAAPSSQQYEVYLAESPLFPESGGQPCDLGVLRVLSGVDGGGDAPTAINVTAVAWKDGRLAHTLDAPLEPGARVEVAVDWERRYDHMQQHTGQHVFSAVADLLYGADTASWELHPLEPAAHAGGDYGCVSVDLTLPALTAEQVQELEARANEELRAVRRVEPLVLDPRSPADLERMEALRADPTFRGKLPPPEKIKGGRLRLVHVEGLDINACGGTHVRCTGEVQLLKVVGVERTRGQTRVRMMTGGRALAALGGCLVREASLTAKLTVPPSRQEEFVDMLLRDRRDGSKARKLLAAELAALLGKQLALAAAAAPSAKATGAETAAPGPPAAAATPARWAALHRPAADLDFLSLMASAALEASPHLQLLLLTTDNTEPGAPPAPAPKPGVEDSVEVTFLLAGQPDLVKTAGAKVAEALGGRGGGRPGRYQGKATGMSRLHAACRAFEEAVAAAGLLSA
ncbi:hypothetical protein HYH02_007100 [Chlamydomonas schloesseri]|uniref:Alanyl-transfer RNA synthetases family profile domain-containing protein n=1 Tax=Chlamydomonas schloesseri TaxID=2026947 RepID=A0A835WII6_9CHLO|nr:hypothetical protein HYH02_007100 [Chlamydomonas schloesseri]|eukprot:KAG2448075.1 hypothetical protein HYH02_007100 [Chlamydomonas schloesseri]